MVYVVSVLVCVCVGVCSECVCVRMCCVYVLCVCLCGECGEVWGGV